MFPGFAMRTGVPWSCRAPLILEILVLMAFPFPFQDVTKTKGNSFEDYFLKRYVHC